VAGDIPSVVNRIGMPLELNISVVSSTAVPTASQNASSAFHSRILKVTSELSTEGSSS
jgi:hypothetical protein